VDTYKDVWFFFEDYFLGTFDPDLSNNQAIDFISVLDTADLSLTKWAEVESWDEEVFSEEDPATAGRRIRYHLTVFNAGPSTAENVLVADRLPAGVSLGLDSLRVNGEPAQDQCITGTPGNPLEPLTCGLGNLMESEEAHVDFEVWVDPSVPQGAILENDAWVTSDIFDPSNLHNFAFTQTLVESLADLSLRKVAESGTWYAGEEHNYTLTVQNYGPSLARTIVIEDYLPSKVEFVSATLDTGEEFKEASCDLTPQNKLRCYLEQIVPGEINKFIIKVRILPGEDVVIYNEAFVSSETNDPNEINDSDYAYKPIWTIFDLAVEKSAPEHIFAGQEMFYDLTVTNSGSTTFYPETNGLIDALPEFGGEPLVYYLDSTNPLCDNDEMIYVICSLPELSPGESISFSIKVLVRPDLLEIVGPAGEDGTYDILNQVSINNFGDDNAINDYAEALTVVEDLADLRVTKFSKPDNEVRAGELFTYTIFVDNLGPSYSRGVVIQDNILSSGDFEIIDIKTDRDYESTIFNPQSPDLVEVNWFDLWQTTNPLSSWQQVPGNPDTGFFMRLDPDVPMFYLDTNNVWYTGDLDEGLYPFFVDTYPSGFFDFMSTKGVSAAALPGSWEAWMWEIINGNEPIFYLEVTPGPSYKLVDGLMLDWPLGPQINSFLQVWGDYIEGDYSYLGDLGEDSTMLAKISFRQPSQNCFIGSEMVDGLPGLSAPSGDDTIFCVLGPGGALEPQGWYPEEWYPTAMPAGQAPLHGEILSGRWTIKVVVQANETQDINNIVDVFTENYTFEGDLLFRGTPDPDLSNNQAIDFISVLDASDLALTKSVVGEVWWGFYTRYQEDQVSLGLPISYTLSIFNSGASTAENVVLQDNIPPEFELVSITPSQGRCLRGVQGDLSKPMTCNIGTLAPETEATVVVVMLVPEDLDVGTMVYNEAWLFSDIFDPDTSNNLDSSDTEVVPQYHVLWLTTVIHEAPPP